MSYSIERAVREDGLRAACLDRVSPRLERKQRKCAKRLARQLRSYNKSPETLASAAFFYERREAILDHLVRLARQKFRGELMMGTLLPRRSKLSNLSHFNPKRFLERLRKDLERAGARNVPGFVFAQVHGEFDIGHELWDPHYHLVVAGADMAAIVDGLRDTGKYRFIASEIVGASRLKQKTPVVLKRIKPDELRYTLSYMTQTWWPAHWTGEDAEGRELRSNRRRLPDEQHAEFLLWLDQQPINHQFLLFGLEVRGGKIRLSRRGKKYADQ